MYNQNLYLNKGNFKFKLNYFLPQVRARFDLNSLPLLVYTKTIFSKIGNSNSDKNLFYYKIQINIIYWRKANVLQYYNEN